MKLSLLFLLLLIAIVNSSYAFGTKQVNLDALTSSAALAGDATGLVQGCGAQPIVGFTYCRVTDGDSAAAPLIFIGPPTDCSRSDACVFLKVFNNQGEVAWGASIPKGQTEISVPWSVLLASPTFSIGTRGFWSFTEQVFFKGSDGLDHDTTAQGDIVLRVTAKGYVALNDVLDDPNFVWSWIDSGYEFKMTTGLRAYVGKAASK